MKTWRIALALVALVCAVFVCAAAGAETRTGTCGTNLTWTLEDDGTLTISGEGAMSNYNAYYNTPSWGTPVKTVVIEDGVTSIGNYAFYNCASLTGISIPDSVTSIGGFAFDYCSKLTDIHIDSIESWLAISYNNYSSHPNYYGSARHLYIGEQELTNVTIPEGVTSIPAYAFYRFNSLTSISIPDSVTGIGYAAFENCTSLTSISIPDSVTSIGVWAFAYCSSLTSISIPDGDTSIGDYAFYYCTSLTSISIPDGVTSIGNYAFSDCWAKRYATLDSAGAKALGAAGYSFWESNYNLAFRYWCGRLFILGI